MQRAIQRQQVLGLRREPRRRGRLRGEDGGERDGEQRADHAASIAAAPRVRQCASRLQRAPSGNKASGLPVGISGPVVRQRPGARVRDCSLSISLPRFGDAPRRSSVFIGTENTYSEERYLAALAKAIGLRERAEAAYQRAATRAKRAEAQEMLRSRPARRRAKA